jgi:hypothetical protein
MWWPTEVDFMVREEKFKDLQREAARERLADEAHQQGPARPGRKMLHWLGGQMIRIGTRLQH